MELIRGLPRRPSGGCVSDSVEEGESFPSCAGGGSRDDPLIGFRSLVEMEVMVAQPLPRRQDTLKFLILSLKHKDKEHLRRSIFGSEFNYSIVAAAASSDRSSTAEVASSSRHLPPQSVRFGRSSPQEIRCDQFNEIQRTVFESEALHVAQKQDNRSSPTSNIVEHWQCQSQQQQRVGDEEQLLGALVLVPQASESLNAVGSDYRISDDAVGGHWCYCWYNW